MNIDAKEGTKVICNNFNQDAVKWGGNDDPKGILEIGKSYTVKRTEIHSWHTKVILKEFPNNRFNSGHFE